MKRKNNHKKLMGEIVRSAKRAYKDVTFKVSDGTLEGEDVLMFFYAPTKVRDKLQRALSHKSVEILEKNDFHILALACRPNGSAF